MEKTARTAIGHQRADTLLLSRTAEADPVPILEIENSDVNATHAATVGRVDSEKLFYLFSRGIGEKEARALYVTGFLQHALGKISFPAFVERVREKLNAKLGISSVLDVPFYSSESNPAVVVS